CEMARSPGTLSRPRSQGDRSAASGRGAGKSWFMARRARGRDRAPGAYHTRGRRTSPACGTRPLRSGERRGSICPLTGAGFHHNRTNRGGWPRIFDMRTQLAKEDRGTKREDPETGKKFYDLNRDPIISPYTGKSYPRSFFEQVTVRGKTGPARGAE